MKCLACTTEIAEGFCESCAVDCDCGDGEIESVAGSFAVPHIREWLDRRKMNPCSPSREQVEFVELLIDDLGAR